MLLEKIEDPGLAQYSNIVGPTGGPDVAVVDPGRDIDVYLEWSQRNGARIAYVLETHIHADYASGARDLAIRTEATLLVSGLDAGQTYQATFPHHDLSHGSRVAVGPIDLVIVHTPGHTPEHLSFLVHAQGASEPLAMLSGDFLLVGSVGRPDLLGEAESAKLADQLYESVQNLGVYRDTLPVFPAHGAGSMCGAGMGQAPSTTLGHERRSNPYLNPALTREAFVQRVLATAPLFPPYYRRMKRLNAAGLPLLHGIPGQNPLDADEFHNRIRAGHVVIDLRKQTDFGNAHISLWDCEC